MRERQYAIDLEAKTKPITRLPRLPHIADVMQGQIEGMQIDYNNPNNFARRKIEIDLPSFI